MPIAETLINNPIGYNMDVLAERLRHVQPLLDLHSWKTIFDVGAMDGWEGTNMAKIFTDARIYAFEPSKNNVERCTKTYMLQPYSVRSRIALSNIALTDITGPMKFWAVDEDTAANYPGKGKVNIGIGSIFKLKDPDMWPWEHNAQMQVDIQSYRLDDYCVAANIDSVDVIWMDVQGAELKVLQGAQDQLANVQCIMTEAGLIPYYEGHTLKTDIDAYLTSMGFIEIEQARELPHAVEVNAIYVNQRFLKH
jgi:FkbM family methyltransferase